MLGSKIREIRSKLFSRSFMIHRSTSPQPRACARVLHSTTAFDAQTAPLPSTATPLHKIIYDSIKAKGPMSVAQYMELCLSDPVEGYYMKSEPIGVRGDFITSPEISQLFGELVGIWLVSQWLERGMDRPIQMVELGPGRGTLMDDMLRTIESIEQTRGRVQVVHLVETSDKLWEEQKNRLGNRIPVDLLLRYKRIEDIPKNESMYTLLVAHEFFDAIPIRIIVKTAGGFQEVLIDIDRTVQTLSTSSLSQVNNSSPLVNDSPAKPQSSGFRYVLSSPLSPAACNLDAFPPRFLQVPTGHRIEVSPSSRDIARRVGELIGGGGGAGLVIDYGDDRAFGSSFRGFHKHKIVDVFHQPGLCDLTANVDFASLKEALESTPTISHGPINQRTFLANMGAPIRLHRLLQGAKDDETRERLKKGAVRLMDLVGMGGQYKVMGITSREKQEQVYPFGA